MEYADIIVRLRKIVRSINLESKRIEKEYGISIPQLLCLTFLSSEKDYQRTQKEIARYLNLNSSTVTGIIGRLEKKGLAARLPKKGDKRVTYIALTSKGAKLLERTPSVLQEKLTQKLKDLPVSVTDEIRKSLDLLIDTLGIEDVDASPFLSIDDPLEKND